MIIFPLINAFDEDIDKVDAKLNHMKVIHVVSVIILFLYIRNAFSDV